MQSPGKHRNKSKPRDELDSSTQKFIPDLDQIGHEGKYSRSS
jgi:hypothetical protein